MSTDQIVFGYFSDSGLICAPRQEPVPHKSRASAREFGAHDGIRTRDLFLTKEVLYRLSYMGIRTMLFSVKNNSQNSLPLVVIENLERETGLEPATPSLEGSRSTN